MSAISRMSSNVAGPSFARQLAARQSIRWVTVWPQWPYDAQQGNAKPVGDRLRRWPLQGQAKKEIPIAKEMSPKEVEVARAKAHLKIWQDMIKLDWSSWERRFWELRERSIPYDEVTYTLLLHGYLLSHRHSGEVAYNVIEEMERASIHPALVRLNKRLVDAAFELQALDARPEASAWRNLVRMSYHCAVRFQKKRRTRLRDELEDLEPDEVLALNTDDAQRWLERHDKLALPLSTNGMNRFLPSADRQNMLEGRAGQRRGKLARTASSPNLLLEESESDMADLTNFPGRPLKKKPADDYPPYSLASGRGRLPSAGPSQDPQPASGRGRSGSRSSGEDYGLEPENLDYSEYFSERGSAKAPDRSSSSSRRQRFRRRTGDDE